MTGKAASYPRVKLHDGMSGAEYNEYIAEHLREDVFQGQVITALCEAGFDRSMIYHTTFSIRSVKGFPDLFAIRVRDDGITVVAIELKRWGFEPSPEQWMWLKALEAIANLVNGRYPNLRFIVGWFHPKQADAIRELIK